MAAQDDQQKPQPRNLVLCSDGTGNSGGTTRGTNVWRIYQAVDTTLNEPEQLVFYDDGVGTEDFKLFKILGGALGWGLSRNVCQLYQWLVLNYQEGDRIYLFGFSRGAYTVRSLAGMIKCCGLIDTADRPASEIGPAVSEVYRCYRRREEVEAEFGARQAKIHFLGLWDTVGAVGGPPWLRHSRWSPIRMLTSHHDIHANNWTHACHALAVDDERRTFWPELLQAREESGNGGSLQQVWFAGAHSNVGGGYPKDGLAFVALQWMMSHAHNRQLRFTPEGWAEVRHRASAHDRVYDPRSGMAAFYRYSPRYPAKIIRDFGKRYPGQTSASTHEFHDSVFERVLRATADYAPAFVFSQPDQKMLKAESTPELWDRPHGPLGEPADKPPGTARPSIARSVFEELPETAKSEIHARLERVGGTVRARIFLYWALLTGTLTFLGGGIWASYRPNLPELKTPFTQASAALTFVSPMSFLDRFIESLARLASGTPSLSIGILVALVIATGLLFLWRQSLRGKETRRSLNAWQLFRQHGSPGPAAEAEGGHGSGAQE